MDTTSIEREALHFLEVFIAGSKPLDHAAQLVEKLDPLLIYFLVRFLRENQRVSGPGSVGRLLEFVQEFPDLAKYLKNTPDDPMIEWFDDTHRMQEFSSTEKFTNLLIEKLEG